MASFVHKSGILFDPQWRIRDNIYSDGSEAFAIVLACPNTWPPDVSCTMKMPLLDDWFLPKDSGHRDKIASAAKKLDVIFGANTASLGLYAALFNYERNEVEKLYFGGLLLDVKDFDTLLKLADQFNEANSAKLDGMKAFPLRLGKGPVLHGLSRGSVSSQLGVAKWQVLTEILPNKIREIIEFQHRQPPRQPYEWKDNDSPVFMQLWVSTFGNTNADKMNAMEMFIFFDSSKSPFTTITEDLKRIRGEDAGTGTERKITVMNNSGHRIDVHWIHPETDEMELLGDLLSGASTDFNSYVGHAFQVRELPSEETGACEGEEETCRIDHFTENTDKDQSEFLQ